MPSTHHTPDITTLQGAELDAVAGGSAWYELFYAIGEFIGRGERGYSDLVDRNGGVTYTG
jgi:hypothetical protein